MTTQEVMNYLETSLKPQIATLTEAINLALQSSSTVVANSSGAMAILSSALSSTAGNVVLENGVVVPNLKKMLDEVQAVSGSIQAESAQAIAELKEQSRTLIAQMSDAAQGINDNLESGVSSSTYSSEKIQALLSELKRTLESAIATAKDSLSATQSAQGEKITALEVAKQDHAGKIEALESAKSEQAEKIALLESAKATLESGVAEAKELAQNAGVKSINGETGEITGVVKLEGEQTLANKTLNAPILNNATLNNASLSGTTKINNATLSDPKISLGEAGFGEAGQVLISQGKGLAPKWGRAGGGGGRSFSLYIPPAKPANDGTIPENQSHRVLDSSMESFITLETRGYGESIQLPPIEELEVGAHYNLNNTGGYPLTVYFAKDKILGSINQKTTENLSVAENEGKKFWVHDLYPLSIISVMKVSYANNPYIKIDDHRYVTFSGKYLYFHDFKKKITRQTITAQTIHRIMVVEDRIVVFAQNANSKEDSHATYYICAYVFSLEANLLFYLSKRRKSADELNKSFFHRYGNYIYISSSHHESFLRFNVKSPSFEPFLWGLDKNGRVLKANSYDSRALRVITPEGLEDRTIEGQLSSGNLCLVQDENYHYKVTDLSRGKRFWAITSQGKQAVELERGSGTIVTNFSYKSGGIFYYNNGFCRFTESGYTRTPLSGVNIQDGKNYLQSSRLMRGNKMYNLKQSSLSNIGFNSDHTNDYESPRLAYGSDYLMQARIADEQP